MTHDRSNGNPTLIDSSSSSTTLPMTSTVVCRSWTVSFNVRNSVMDVLRESTVVLRELTVVLRESTVPLRPLTVSSSLSTVSLMVSTSDLVSAILPERNQVAPMTVNISANTGAQLARNAPTCRFVLESIMDTVYSAPTRPA